MAKSRVGVVRAGTKGVANTGRKNMARRKGNALSVRQLPQLIQDLSLSERVEQVLIQGDLSPLTPEERVSYYKKVCASLGLNQLTIPFSFILFREGDGAPAKLALYANKSCTEQLRKIHGVSVDPPLRRSRTNDIVTVEADVHDRTGRTDSASGSVPLFKYKDGQRIELTGKELCNAEMKCETKAKRRATLSICGLAILDESELDTMDVVGGVTPDGRIYRYVDPETPRNSHAASQKVLEEKLAGRMPLHPPAEPSQPARQEPASQKAPAKSEKIAVYDAQGDRIA